MFWFDGNFHHFLLFCFNRYGVDELSKAVFEVAKGVFVQKMLVVEGANAVAEGTMVVVEHAKGVFE